MTDVIDFNELLKDESIQETFKETTIEQVGYDKFGQLTELEMLNFIKWEDGFPIPVSFEEWRLLPREGKSFEYKFTIDIEEFDERARDNGWTYERRIRYKGNDWNKIFAPSVKSIFGENALTEEKEGSEKISNRDKTLAKIFKHYLHVRDVPQAPAYNKKTGKVEVPVNEKTGRPFWTIELVKVFDNRETCRDTRNERFGDNTSGGKQSVPKNVAIPTLPEIWVEMPETLQAEYQRRNGIGETIQHIAVTLNIIDVNGNPGLDKNNNPIDSDAVLQWLAETPF